MVSGLSGSLVSIVNGGKLGSCLGQCLLFRALFDLLGALLLFLLAGDLQLSLAFGLYLPLLN